MTQPHEGDGGAEHVRSAVADAYRREWAFVLAATARVAGDIDIAEECAADAFGAALDTWLRDGVPRQARCLADDHRPTARPRRTAPREDAARQAAAADRARVDAAHPETRRSPT